MRMRIGAARSIFDVSICLMVEAWTEPALAAVFGAYATLEQPPRPATISAKKQAFAKRDAIWLKRNVLPALSAEHALRPARTGPVLGAGRCPVLGVRTWTKWVRTGRWRVWRRPGRCPGVDTTRRPRNVGSLRCYTIWRTG